MSKDRAASDQLVHDPAGGIDRLVEIMARLRDPDSGCPWDLEQDFATIAPYTIEEAYEVADAIERGIDDTSVARRRALAEARSWGVRGAEARALVTSLLEQS